MSKFQHHFFLMPLSLTLFAMSILLTTVNPSLSLANSKCFGIFEPKAQLESLSLFQDMRNFLEKSGIEENDLSGPKLNALRKNVTNTLQKAFAKVKTANELIALFYAIDNFSEIGNYSSQSLLKETLRHVDFFAPLRGQYQNLSKNDKEAFLHILQRFASKRKKADALSWKPHLLAMEIIESPARASEILEELLNTKESLQGDFQYSGEMINRSLIKSLEELHFEQRRKLISALSNRIKELDIWISKHKFASEADRTAAKEERRNPQFLQRLLLQKEFAEVIEAVLKIHGSLEQKTFAIAKIENYLLLTKMNSETEYKLDLVFQISRKLKSETNAIFDKRDSVEIFGSFPNLIAKRSSSDIDLIFNSRYEAVYLSQVKGGVYEDGTINEPAGVTNASGHNLVRALLAMDKTARTLFASTAKPGNFLSVATLPRSFSSRGEELELNYPETLRFLTQFNPITILITADKIFLRIYDGISVAPQSPAKIYQIEI